MLLKFYMKSGFLSQNITKIDVHSPLIVQHTAVLCIPREMIRWRRMIVSFKMAPKYPTSWYFHLWVVPSHIVSGLVCVINRMWQKYGMSLLSLKGTVFSSLLSLSQITQSWGSQMACYEDTFETLQRSPHDEELRPPTKSHGNEPSWKWFLQPWQTKTSREALGHSHSAKPFLNSWPSVINVVLNCEVLD